MTGLSDADRETLPYDEDGYCHFCGNGRWKAGHGLDCPWADAMDRAADRARAEVTAAVEALIDQWPTGDNGQDYRSAVTQCAAAVRAVLADPAAAAAKIRAEALREAADEWSSEGRAVMFNKDGTDLNPQQRVGKWLRDRADREAQP